MANQFPAYILAHPSYMMPEMIVQQQQPSGAFEQLSGRAPMTRLGTGDLYVYLKKLDVRTKIAAGQTAYNALPSITITASMISTPTYLMRVRAEYDHHDVAAGANWGVSVPEEQRLGMRQANFQQARVALLYGFNPANGEGMLSAAGITAINLPADSNGNTGFLSYDNGQMAFFLLQQIGAVKTRTLQLGQPSRVTITAPQRVISSWQYQGIVQTTQFQRVGAGTANIADLVETAANGDTIEWCYDDTLIGQGAGGTDAVIITIPDIHKPKGPGNLAGEVNGFANLSPSIISNNVMLCDVPAPIEITTPLPGGAIDVLSEMRITSGWVLRPEAVTVVSMPNS